MRKDYLIMLADHLDQFVKDDEFDTGHWKCGTTACAAGHATSIFYQLEMVTEERILRNENEDVYSYYIRNRKSKRYGFQALEDFFELNKLQVSYIFSELWYEKMSCKITKTRVSNRIRDLVTSVENGHSIEYDILYSMIKTEINING